MDHGLFLAYDERNTQSQSGAHLKRDAGPAGRSPEV